MSSTTWLCEKCGVSRVIDVPEGASVYEGVYAIEDDHAAHSPRCEFDLGKVRLNPGAVNDMGVMGTDA